MELKESIFTTITKLSNANNAINLGQGFPNFPPDPKLVNIIQSIAGESIHQYAPMQGNPKLVQKIGEMVSHFYGRDLNASNILVTAGATQAIFTTITALVRKGDEVVIFDPAYDCYDPPIQLSGGRAIHINLTFPEYKIDWKDLRTQLSDKTKLMILNNPHNPSGAIFDAEDIEELHAVLKDYPKLMILSDEVYEYISFEKHLSLNNYPKIRERAIIISSFGKTLHLTGWKIGYLVAEESVLKKIIQVHQYNVFSVNSLCQEAIAQFIELPDIENLAPFFQKKKNTFLEVIQKSRFKILPSKGTYFQLLDYSSISKISDNQMAIKLINEIGVASIPISGFYKDNKEDKVLRFCFGKDDETLIKAAEKLCQI